MIPVTVSIYHTRNVNNIPQLKVKHNFLRNSFFPFAVIEWSKLDLIVRNSESLNIFKKSLLKFIRPSRRIRLDMSVFNCHKPRVVKLLTRVRLSLSHLHEQKFKHGFEDSLKDTLKAFNNFKNKQRKYMKQYFLIRKSMYILKVYSIQYTLR